MPNTVTTRPEVLTPKLPNSRIRHHSEEDPSTDDFQALYTYELSRWFHIFLEIFKHCAFCAVCLEIS
jgi:hypothetical protein